MQHMAKLLVAVVFSIALVVMVGMDIGSGKVGEIILGGASSLLGALIAFYWNHEKEYKKEIKSQVASANRTLITLGLQLNAVLNIYQVYRMGERFPRNYYFYNTYIITLPDYSRLVHDYRDLEFLIAAEKPQALINVSNGQDQFFQVLNAISNRNVFLTNRLKPWFDRNVGSMPAPGDIDRIPQGLKDESELYWSVLEGGVVAVIKSLSSLIAEVDKESRKAYPGELFVGLPKIDWRQFAPSVNT